MLVTDIHSNLQLSATVSILAIELPVENLKMQWQGPLPEMFVPARRAQSAMGRSLCGAVRISTNTLS